NASAAPVRATWWRIHPSIESRPRFHTYLRSWPIGAKEIVTTTQMSAWCYRSHLKRYRGASDCGGRPSASETYGLDQPAGAVCGRPSCSSAPLPAGPSAPFLADVSIFTRALLFASASLPASASARVAAEGFRLSTMELGMSIVAPRSLVVS